MALFKRKEAISPRWTPKELAEHQDNCVRSSAFRLVHNDWATVKAEYLLKNGTILDTDRAKELFPVYSKNLQSQARWSSAVYKPASEFIDKFYTELLQVEAEERPSNLILFLAGGPGSGKSTFVVNNPATENAYLILDGTLSDFDRASDNIYEALFENYEVHVIHVYRPFDEAVKGVIERGLSIKSGRVVPLSVVAEKHFRSARCIKDLNALFSGIAEFDFFQYRGIGRPFTLVSVDTVIEDLGDIDNLQQRAYSVLEEIYEARRHLLPEEAFETGEQPFSEAIYAAFHR